MKFYIADAFTENLFGGNPAGVVILGDGEDFPSDEIMVKTAAELRYSETAFIRQLSDKEFNIRYFTPAAEVDLCGHATIASFFCLLDAGLVKNGEEYTNKTKAGDLKIQIANNFIMMEMASPELIATIDSADALDELYEIMGISYEPVTAENGVLLLPKLVSTGLPDIMMPVSSRKQLAELMPDMAKLAKLSEKYGVTGVHAFTLESSDSDVTANCRNFAPLYDIDEEAATGTSNGALTYYLFDHGLIGNDSRSIFVQGEAMNRPSKILSKLHDSNGKVEIQVGGNAAVLAKGNIFI